MTFNTGTVEGVTSFKLCGVTIANNLNWDEHVNVISAKANERSHFSKLLKRLSVTRDDLPLNHEAVIRPVTECAPCSVWHQSRLYQTTRPSRNYPAAAL